MIEAHSLLYSERSYRSSVTRENYKTASEGKLLCLDGRTPSPSAYSVHRALCDFIKSDGYPCVGARAALNGGDYRLGHYSDMGSADASSRLAQDLSVFIAQRPYMKTDFATMIAVFDNSDCRSEVDFEGHLWKQLQALHDIDEEPYDPAVSSDSEDSRFAFSFGGCAFFVIGLHPGSSRMARRFAWPALVFNPHDQFESLRRKGVYQRLGRIVRSRDISFQGSLNPSLAEFGQRSEARQYAGRKVERWWKCPFRV